MKTQLVKNPTLLCLTLAIFAALSIDMDSQQDSAVGMKETQLGGSGGGHSKLVPSWPRDTEKRSTHPLLKLKVPSRQPVRI